MAWEWSHTTEALNNAYYNVCGLSKRKLVGIMMCWFLEDFPDEPLRGQKKKRREYNQLSQDVLAEAVWERASELRTCTNGGYEAYLDPDGDYTVPFDLTRAGRKVLNR